MPTWKSVLRADGQERRAVARLLTAAVLVATFAFLVSPAAAAHVWAIGAIGAMTLAMMTRATLGHMARPLAASRATQLIYLAVIAVMFARIAMEVFPAATMPLMYGAAIAWIAAFAGFVVAYGPMLWRPISVRG